MKRIPFVLFITILIFAPLAFGTVEEWSIMTVELLIAATVIFLPIYLVPRSGKLISVPGLIPLLLLIGFMTLQVTPLPVGFIKIISPSSYQSYQPVHEMLIERPWMPLSVYQKATVHDFMRIVSYIFFYILTIQLLSNGERIKKAILICSGLSIGISVLAILQYYSSPDFILWLRVSPPKAQPMGPWVYRSQYCGYIGMMAPIVLALALYYRPVSGSDDSLRQRIVSFFTNVGCNYSVLLGFGFLILVSSIFISLSKGGIISSMASILFFLLLFERKRAGYRSNLTIISVIGCLIGSIALFGWNPIIESFSDIINNSGEVDIGRFPVWLDSLRVFKDFWLTGSGFGTFIAIFPQYRTFLGNSIFDHAHNDYIELLTDGGIIGFVLAGWFIVAVIQAGWKMINCRRDRYAKMMSIGALAGLTAMLIYSISDFNMHNYADGLYFFFLCGLLVSTGNTKFYFKMEVTLLKPSKWLSREIFVFAGVIFFCSVILLKGGAIIADWKFQNISNFYLSRHLSEKHLYQISYDLNQMSQLDPFEGLYPALQGNVQRYLLNPENALENYIEAGRRDPLNGAFLQQIGMMLPKDQQESAKKLIEIGSDRSLQKNDLLLDRVEWLLKTNQRIEAINALRKGLEQNPVLIKEVIPLLQEFLFTRQELVAVLPQRVEAWLQAGSFLENLGSIDDAVYLRENALDYLDRETTVKAEWFSQLYGFYRQRKDEEKALAVVRQGLEKIPDYPRFHEWLGDHYAKEAITYRALEEYRQVLLLEPGNTSVRRKMDKLSTMTQLQ